MTELPEHAVRNREVWTKANAEDTDAKATEAWAQEEITWGMFSVPEAEVGVLGDVAGLDVVELGCGTAYVSAWLARLGARVVGVDVTEEQLATARRMQQEHGLRLGPRVSEIVYVVGNFESVAGTECLVHFNPGTESVCRTRAPRPPW